MLPCDMLSLSVQILQVDLQSGLTNIALLNGMFSGGKELSREGAGLEIQKKLRKALKEVTDVAARLEGLDN